MTCTFRLSLLASLILAAVPILPLAAQPTPLSSARQGGAILPQPDPPFGGVIGRTAQESRPDFPAAVQAPQGAPNVLLIMLDDVGYGQFGTFGGLTPTPSLDALAQQGLRYTHMHTVGLCSPTRAAMLTGRNAHSVGNGIITGLATGFPGYNAIIPRDAGTVAQVLRGNGYATAMFGKNHNTPEWQASPAGPFHQWPTGLGFDYFLGFNYGEMSQWNFSLTENTRNFELPAEARGTHLTTFLTDRAIGWMREQRSVAPDRPFFLYFATGATHSPHQAPAEWIARFRGQFDMGWDRYREMVFERQKRLGVIPQDALLTPRPAELPAWDALSADQRRVATRMMEVFAGFTAHTDAEIGRLIASLGDMGARENTLVIYMVGDNGASAEGGLEGSTNALRAFNGIPDDLVSNLAAIDGLGGPMYANHFPAGWAWAMNTPFQWTKQVASHFGGTRNPLVVSWPGRVQAGATRDQFHHVIDLMPTILEAANLRLPIAIEGIQQRPLDGVSMAYTFAAEGARAEGRRRTQAWEMFINRGIYHDGWMASARWRTPWDATPRTGSIDDATWELYHVARDFSQARDLAAAEPQRLRAMQDLWWAEAARQGILPLDNRTIERFDPAQRPNLAGGRTSFTYYPGLVQLQTGAAPSVLNRSFTISAEVEVPQGGGTGMLVTHGGRQSGYGFYMDGGRLMFTYNMLAMERFTIASDQPLAPGRRVLRAEFVREGERPGSGGTLTLFDGDRRVGQGRIGRTNPARLQIDEGLDIGLDDGTPLTEDYAERMPFRFDGQIARVTIDLH